MSNQETYSNKSEYISANLKHLNAIVKLVKCSCLVSMYLIIFMYTNQSHYNKNNYFTIVTLTGAKEIYLE